MQAIYVLHPTFGLKSAILALQMFVDSVVCKTLIINHWRMNLITHLLMSLQFFGNAIGLEKGGIC